MFIGKPHTRPKAGDMFAEETVCLAQLAIADLLAAGAIEKRPKANGSTTWGDLNKYAIHRRTGVPLDLFATTEASWWNYLVCRTGSAGHNAHLAARAKQLGYTWNPYGPGLTGANGEPYAVTSEEDLFRFLLIPFVPPYER